MTERNLKTNIVTANEPVIVLARNFSTALGVIRALGERGYDVYLIALSYRKGALAPAAASRYLKGFTEVVCRDAMNDGEHRLLEAIRTLASPDRKTLFPTDDFTAYVTDKNRASLEKNFNLPSADEDLWSLMDKSRQNELAKAAGFESAGTLSLTAKSCEDSLKSAPYPCFCRHARSLRGQKSDMKICRGPEELRAYLQDIDTRAPGSSVLVQKYLNIDCELDIAGVCCKSNVVTPGYIKKTAVSKHQPGITMSGTLCGADEEFEPIKKLKKMLAGLNYRGMFDAEIIVSEGEYYFGEINFRCGGPSHVYDLLGVNLPDMAVRSMRGESLGDAAEIPVEEASFVLEKAVLEDEIFGNITHAEAASIIGNAALKLLADEEDPAPERIYKKQLRRLKRNAAIKKIIGR